MWLPLLALAACSTGEVPVSNASLETAEPDRLRLVAIGDVGKDTEAATEVAAAVAQVCATSGCDLVVLLGDNLYPRGMEAPDDPRMDGWIRDRYAAVDAPLWLVLGNHDYGHGRSRQRAGWQVLWAERTAGANLPALAWVLDAGPARIVGLDTNAALQFGEKPQAELLERALGERPDAWSVVLGHHPFRSDGRHGNAGAYDGWRHVPWVSGGSLKRLFDDGLCDRADLYLSGHDHNRQLIEHCGVDLIVSGAGASTTELVDRGNDPLFAAATPGLVWLELGPDAATVRFHDASGREEASFVRPRGR